MTTDQREQLVLEHLPLVRQIAAVELRRVPPHVDRRDLESAGVLGLLTAARRFDPDRGVAFATMAGHRIRGAILDEMRRAAPYTRGQQRAIAGETWFPLRKVDFDEAAPVVAPSVDVPDALHARAVRDAVKALPRREALLLIWRFWHGLRHDDIAPRLGLKQSRVSQLEHRALTRLRTHLEPLQ
jgi:RNA polymerase sigma factor (sigma-70 family)